MHGLDGPAPERIVGQRVVGVDERAMYNQYGRQVVVVQPGDILVMGGQRNIAVPMDQIDNPNINQNNIPNSNQYFN